MPLLKSQIILSILDFLNTKHRHCPLSTAPRTQDTGYINDDFYLTMECDIMCLSDLKV